VSPDARSIVEADLVTALAASPKRPLIVGLCGSQGSGKSTLAAALQPRLAAQGFRTAILSLDDLYLTATDRATLGETVHPLVRTRGVPGTHDIALAHRMVDALGRAGTVQLPRFDKAADDRATETLPVEGPVDLILFEGWCVGARPEAPEALAAPINALERNEDPEGRWRRFVNMLLAGTYRTLFDRIDRLILLAAPSFDIVHRWRTQQEDELRARSPAGVALMDAAAIAHFIQHYERLTRHILAEMPGRADLTLRLNDDRGVIAVERPEPPQ
jgi:D-glycerate 3-kinase